MKLFGIKLQWRSTTSDTAPVSAPVAKPPSLPSVTELSQPATPGLTSASEATSPRAKTLAPMVTFSIGSTSTIDKTCTPGHYYVYRHRAKDGKVFYVGKGTGDRAWSKDRGVDHQQYVEKFSGGQYDVEIVRRDISEDDALDLEDVLMKQHADTIINLQNIHAPLNSPKLAVYSEAMSAFTKQRDLAMVLALEGKPDQASTQFTQAYASYLVCRDNSDFEVSARNQLERPNFGPNRVLCETYGKFLVAQNRLDDLAEFIVQLKTDYALSDDDSLVAAILKRLERARKAKPKVELLEPYSPYQLPSKLPSGWERAKENREDVVRLCRNQAQKGFDYLDAIEPGRDLRRSGKLAELLELMKQAVISAEIEAQKEKHSPAPQYSLEAARACRELGDVEQECLFLHRYDVLSRRYGAANPEVVGKLVKAWQGVKRAEA